MNVDGLRFPFNSGGSKKKSVSNGSDPKSDWLSLSAILGERKTNSGSSGAKYKLTPSSGTGGGATSSKTPRSGASTTSSSAPRSQLIAAIAEGRGLAKGEIGLASMDLRLSELGLTQFSDTSGYSRLRIKLQVLSPIEILVPETAAQKGGNMAVLVQLLQADFPNTQITTVSRKHFNDERGLECINKLKVPECSTLQKDIKDKYYCLSCVAALIKYIEFIQNIIFAPASVKITYKGVENTCMIDPLTVKYLELIVSLKDVKDSESSLFGILNSTFTSCGSRMLRSTLLQPSTVHETIEMRLDAVQELLSNEHAFTSLRELISRMVDIDQLVTLCAHLNKEETVRIAEYKITQVIYLKHTLELVEPFRQCLTLFKCPLLKTFHEHMLCDNRFKHIIARIDDVIDGNVHLEKGNLSMKSLKCFAVKAGMNGLLDVARRSYTELIDQVNVVASEETAICPYPLRTCHSASRGFHLQLRIKDLAMRVRHIDLPPVCINVVRQKNTIFCTTRTMIQMNDRIAQTVSEIYLLSNRVVTELLAELRQFIGCLYNLTEVIAVVDMLLSIAHFCSLSGDVVRPMFDTAMAVRQGRHPLLERLTDQSVTSNDTYAGPESSFVVITGPNMAGKSTYLKQVALLQILAQAGSFVPAEYATFKICNQIFSRIGHNDDFENGSSAFMVEMKDTNYILQNISSQSLVVIDELGRSTSTEEGIGICHAICERMIESGAFVFFATHFLDLTNLDCLYPNVENYHFASQVSPGDERKELRLDHTLHTGPYKGPIYGFELAQVSALPDRVLNHAKQLAHQIRDKHQTRVKYSVEFRRKKALFRLGHQILQVLKYAPDADTNAVRDHLLTVRQEYLTQIKTITEVHEIL